MAEDINVGSASVSIVPSAEGFIPKVKAQVIPAAEKLGRDIAQVLSDRIAPAIKRGMTEGFAGGGTVATQQGRKAGDNFGGEFSRTAKAKIEAALKSLPKAQIGVATTAAEQKLKDLRAEMETLLNKEIGIDITDAEAIAQIDRFKVRLDALAAESPSVQVKVDTLAASAQLLAFRAELAAVDGSKAGGSIGTGLAASLAEASAATTPLAIGIAAVGTALVPVVASAAGLAAALVLPLSAAGGGLTLFGLLAGKAIGNTNKLAKQIDELKKKAASLVDPKARANAAAQAKALEDSLTRPQKAFLKAKESLSRAFGGLLGGKTGGALFAPIVAGMNLLAKILPKVQPVILAVSAAITGLLDDLSKSADGKGFTNFIDGFAKLAGGTITSAAKSIGLFGEGLFNIFRDFLPLSKSVGDGFESLGKKFVDFSNKASTKKGIQDFVGYVRENGPKVAAFFGNLIVSLVRLGTALAPIGAKLIDFGTKFLEVFNKIPIGTLRYQLTGPIVLLGESFKRVGRIFGVTYNSVIGPVFQFILKSIGFVLDKAGDMLSILGKAPGFGWARDLGDKLHKAASDASGLGDAIKHLPSGKVKVDTSDLDKVERVSLSTNASLRKLLGLPPLKPKVNTKEIDKAIAAASTFGGAILAANGLPVVKPKVNKSQIDAANRQSLALINYQRALLGQPPIKPKVDKRQVDAAVTATNKLLTALRNVFSFGNKTIKVNTIYKTTGNPNGKTGPQAASGGYIRGPGTGVSDSIAAWLSNGEFVVNAKATAKNLPLLHQINAQGFAAGGLAAIAQASRPQQIGSLESSGDTFTQAFSPLSLADVALHVTIGADSRTKAAWVIEGQKIAGRIQ